MTVSILLAIVICSCTSLPISEGTGIAGRYAFEKHNESLGCDTGNPSKRTEIGFIAAAIAVVFFGSQYLPVKKFDTGDGIFFQWVMCIGIWICGVNVHLVMSYNPPSHMNITESLFNGHGRTPFQPLAMLGGFFWATGNVLCVPVVKCIGMGLGLLVWGTVNCLGGWASSRFGLFGLHVSKPNNEAENFIGVALCILGVIIFFFVKSEGKTQRTNLHQKQKIIAEDEKALLSSVCRNC
jgi:uncharacterized membrane protein YidH (DUF202 family)